MGLLNKIKDILFEEIDGEETEKAKKDTTKSVSKPIAEKIEPQKRENIEEEVIKTPKISDPLEDKDLLKSSNGFTFPDFDEMEFSNMSRVQKPKQTTNVLEYERTRKVEKKYDLGRYERVERTEVVEKKKFKPSQIISPVYGILNEDYKPEDIKQKETSSNGNKIDFDSVRKKAFEAPKKEEPTKTYYEETVTVKLKEDEAEKKEKVKTIDELLENTSDIVIDTKNSMLDDLDILEDSRVTNNTDVYENLEDDLEELTEKKDVSKKESKDDVDDTLENDLFDLIDSMYDNREDGDI